MYAIVEIAGKQFKVDKGKYIYTNTINQPTGASLSFGKVLLLHDEKKIQVGAPTLPGVTIRGKIIEHVKGDKLIVFKKKRRKGYKVKQGHRQGYTKVLIEHI